MLCAGVLCWYNTVRVLYQVTGNHVTMDVLVTKLKFDLGSTLSRVSNSPYLYILYKLEVFKS